MIREFNILFYNEAYYADGHRHPMLLEKEANRDTGSPYFRDLLEFCMHTDVVKQLGLSLTDLMNLDLPSFLELKDVVLKENERKAMILEKESKQQQQRQTSLLNHIRSR